MCMVITLYSICRILQTCGLITKCNYNFFYHFIVDWVGQSIGMYTMHSLNNAALPSNQKFGFTDVTDV